ncbi:primosomal protein [Microbacterium sp. R86528]|uniref:primosomal protein n=1 Tax=Microbacterium sp. R86528 TaxID=3093864 RepID=UPI0037C792D9
MPDNTPRDNNHDHDRDKQHKSHPPRNGQRKPDSSRNGERRPYPARDGERKPYQRDGERKPYSSRDGERKSYPPRDGERKRYSSRDGERKSYPPRDGERKPYQRDGERKSYPPRDGQRKSYPPRDGERKSYPPRDGERKSYPPRDGEQRKSYPPRDAERKPYQRDGERKPYPPRDGERKPYQRDGERKSYSSRDGERKSYPPRDGERKPYSSRDGERKSYPPREGGNRGSRPTRGGADRPDRATRDEEIRPVRPHHNDPVIPDEITANDLHPAARNELKTLTKENADWVARHLAMAANLIDTDPELAHQHAISAARRAGRIGITRETLAITAYTLGDYALALREIRTYRRITGRDDLAALMVDSERGIGRPDKALETGRAINRNTLPTTVRVHLAIALSGAHLDQNHPEKALRELDIPELDPTTAHEYSPALFTARATIHEQLGQTTHTQKWAHHAQQAQHALNQHHNTHHHETIEIMSIDDDEDELDVAPDQAARTERSARSAGSDDLSSSEVAVDEEVAVVAGHADHEVGETAHESAGEAHAQEAQDVELTEPLANDDSASDIAPVFTPDATQVSVEDEVAEILIEAGIDEAPESSGD